MFLMGSDFQYENADGWYKNLDKIIHHVNADGRVNTFYSTPEEYTAAKLAENITWPVKTDDFMPLANDEHSYWTGFYSSRPALKRYERQLAGFLQAARQVPLRYVDGTGAPTTEWPANPNGSAGGAGALCDASGRLFGLMPHPEAFLYAENHPRWRARHDGGHARRWGEGVQIFANGVRAALDAK